MLEGNISIGRPTFGNGKKAIVIEIRDDNSQTQFVDVEIDYENFTKAIFGESHIPVKFRTRALDKVGLKIKKMEALIEVKSQVYDKENRKKAIEEALDKFPMGDWQSIDTSRVYNHYYRKGFEPSRNTEIYPVTLYKWTE